MKFLTEYLVFNTEKRIELLNITSEIEALVRKSGVKEGLCLKKLGKKTGGHNTYLPIFFPQDIE
ncbi:MAG: hypothetical protein DRJ06_01215 [Candidatus Aminicenantes bacterium]|nr:MAG: hypothetical protein DRJ06_01215 [Candidatus Aminicenantes bacterium]